MSISESRRVLRRLELEAYACVVTALRAQGQLTLEKKSVLTQLSQQLGISTDRHHAEVRRAICDDDLCYIADCVTGTESKDSWLPEARRLGRGNPKLVARHSLSSTTQAQALTALSLSGIKGGGVVNTKNDNVESNIEKKLPPQVQSALKIVLANHQTAATGGPSTIKTKTQPTSSPGPLMTRTSTSPVKTSTVSCQTVYYRPKDTSCVGTQVNMTGKEEPPRGFVEENKDLNHKLLIDKTSENVCHENGQPMEVDEEEETQESVCSLLITGDPVIITMDTDRPSLKRPLDITMDTYRPTLKRPLDITMDTDRPTLKRPLDIDNGHTPHAKIPHLSEDDYVHIPKREVIVLTNTQLEANTTVPQTTAIPPITNATPPITTATPPITTAIPPITTAIPPITNATPLITTATPLITTATPPITTATPPITTATPPIATATPLSIAAHTTTSTSILPEKTISFVTYDTSKIIPPNTVTSLPITTIPMTTVPMTTIPMITIPMTTIPMTTIPMTTTPMTTVPMTTIPMTTIPMTTVPMTTIPMTTVPMTTIPMTAAITVAPPKTANISIKTPIKEIVTPPKATATPPEANVINVATSIPAQVTVPQTTPILSAIPTNSTRILATPTNPTVIFTIPTDSTVISATPTNPTIVSATPTNPTIVSATPTNSTVISATPTNSTIVSATPTNSTIVSATPTNPTIVSATPTNSTIVSATPTNPTLIPATVIPTISTVIPTISTVIPTISTTISTATPTIATATPTISTATPTISTQKHTSQTSFAISIPTSNLNSSSLFHPSATPIVVTPPRSNPSTISIATPSELITPSHCNKMAAEVPPLSSSHFVTSNENQSFVNSEIISSVPISSSHNPIPSVSTSISLIPVSDAIPCLNPIPVSTGQNPIPVSTGLIPVPMSTSYDLVPTCTGLNPIPISIILNPIPTCIAVSQFSNKADTVMTSFIKTHTQNPIPLTANETMINNNLLMTDYNQPLLTDCVNFEGLPHPLPVSIDQNIATKFDSKITSDSYMLTEKPHPQSGNQQSHLQFDQQQPHPQLSHQQPPPLLGNQKPLPPLSQQQPHPPISSQHLVSFKSVSPQFDINNILKISPPTDQLILSTSHSTISSVPSIEELSTVNYPTLTVYNNTDPATIQNSSLSQSMPISSISSSNLPSSILSDYHNISNQTLSTNFIPQMDISLPTSHHIPSLSLNLSSSTSSQSIFSFPLDSNQELSSLAGTPIDDGDLLATVTSELGVDCIDPSLLNMTDLLSFLPSDDMTLEDLAITGGEVSSDMVVLQEGMGGGGQQTPLGFGEEAGKFDEFSTNIMMPGSLLEGVPLELKDTVEAILKSQSDFDKLP